MESTIKYEFQVKSTKSIRIAIVNHGKKYKSKSGVFAISLKDDKGLDATSNSNLSFSKKLNKFFYYAASNESGNFFELAEVITRAAFTHVVVEYFPLFTETPISEGDFGQLLYSAEVTSPNEGRLIKMAFPVKDNRS